MQTVGLLASVLAGAATGEDVGQCAEGSSLAQMHTYMFARFSASRGCGCVCACARACVCAFLITRDFARGVLLLTYTELCACVLMADHRAQIPTALRARGLCRWGNPVSAGDDEPAMARLLRLDRLHNGVLCHPITGFPGQAGGCESLPSLCRQSRLRL